MVFAGFYLVNSEDYPDRATRWNVGLNDASLVFLPSLDASGLAFGAGFSAAPHGDRAGAT